MPQILIQKKSYRGQQYRESLGNGETLEMVQIPPGEFYMGSPETETDRYDREGPQRRVNIGYGFFIGKYPITQGQWQAVVETVGQIAHPLEPAPSHFQADFQAPDQSYSRWLRPVEQVSWQDAMEFCARLSQKTKRFYRLPSEAEWEYVCRAPSQEQWGAVKAGLGSADEPAQINAWNRRLHQPFYFGETITTDVANYRGTDDQNVGWKGNYGRGPKGIYREETTPVGYFNAPNSFGVHDLHGNVWEWCLDPWHDNYQGDPPNDGRVWDGENIDHGSVNIYERFNRLIEDSRRRVVRGGSWVTLPWYCRSAFRYYFNPFNRSRPLGFRVLCEGPRLS